MLTKEEMNTAKIARFTPEQAAGNSPKRLARIAGLLYLLVAIFGTFALIVVDAAVYVPGDAGATAANIIANAGLVRLGVVADLFQATVFVFLGMTLYLLLNKVQKSAASAMVILVALATGLMCLLGVFRFESLQVATGSAYPAAFGVAGSNGLVLLLQDLLHYGYFIAQIFFGLWLVPLGYLAFKSGMFPKALGVVLILAGISYIVDLLAMFLVPDVGSKIHGVLAIPEAIAEIWLLAYLLVKGVRVSVDDSRIGTEMKTNPVL